MTAHALRVGRELFAKSQYNHVNPIPAKTVELVQSLVIAYPVTVHQIGEDPTVKVRHHNIQSKKFLLDIILGVKQVK